jgi:hypothetical protein
MILRGLRRLDVGTKLMVFVIPFIAVLGLEFMALSMTMGKPFCLQCFESNIFHLRYVGAFVLGYLLTTGLLITIISDDLKSLAKESR